MSYDLKIQNGDFVIEDGDFATVTGSDKLRQDILKIALTEAGGDRFFPWYGSLISRSLIGSSLPHDVLITTATSQLQTALENLKALQNLQVSSGQQVSPSEMISFIKNISITQNNVNPTLYTVLITVLNRAFGQVSTGFSVNNM